MERHKVRWKELGVLPEDCYFYAARFREGFADKWHLTRPLGKCRSESGSCLRKSTVGISVLCGMFVLSLPQWKEGSPYWIVLQLLSSLVVIHFSLRAIIVSMLMGRCWNQLEMHRPWVYRRMHIYIISYDEFIWASRLNRRISLLLCPFETLFLQRAWFWDLRAPPIG